VSTSGSTDFSTTRIQIIYDALLLLNVIAAQETAQPHQLLFCGRFLDMMVKQWAPKMMIWPTKDVIVTLTPGTASYTIGDGLTVDEPRPLQVVSARRRDSSNNEIPIDVVSREEYMAIPTKSTQSPANMVYYDRQRTSGTLHFWPTGDTSSTTAIVTVKRALEDLDSEGDEPDFPQEALMALIYNLAVLVGPAFGGVPQDIAAIAGQLKQELLEDDTENTAVYFIPRFQ
jgi:hypothetical protein